MQRFVRGEDSPDRDRSKYNTGQGADVQVHVGLDPSTGMPTGSVELFGENFATRELVPAEQWPTSRIFLSDPVGL